MIKAVIPNIFFDVNLMVKIDVTYFRVNMFTTKVE